MDDNFYKTLRWFKNLKDKDKIILLAWGFVIVILLRTAWLLPEKL